MADIKESAKKPDPALVATLHDIISEIPGATPRKMFGCDCFFLNGHCAGGIWRDSAIFKLPPHDAKALLKLPGTTPFSPGPTMTMSGWYVLPNALAADPKTLRTWTERAAVNAASLPPKLPKPPKVAKATKPAAAPKQAKQAAAPKSTKSAPRKKA